MRDGKGSTLRCWCVARERTRTPEQRDLERHLFGGVKGHAQKIQHLNIRMITVFKYLNPSKLNNSSSGVLYKGSSVSSFKAVLSLTFLP